MPLSNIQDTIKKQAQEKVAEIEKAAQKKVQEIEAKIEIERNNLIKEIEQKTQSKITSLKEQTKVALEVEARNAVLQKKQELVREAKDNVIESLCKLSGAEYEKIISKLLKKVDIKGEAEVLVPADKEAESKKAINDSGKHLTIKTDKNLKGGFIIRTGKVEINNSFEDIVKQIFEEKEMEIVKLLFE
jgi:V/A-type H+-transporting ATPase subunit E